MLEKKKTTEMSTRYPEGPTETAKEREENDRQRQGLMPRGEERETGKSFQRKSRKKGARFNQAPSTEGTGKRKRGLWRSPMQRKKRRTSDMNNGRRKKGGKKGEDYKRSCAYYEGGLFFVNERGKTPGEKDRKIEKKSLHQKGTPKAEQARLEIQNRPISQKRGRRLKGGRPGGKSSPRNAKVLGTAGASGLREQRQRELHFRRQIEGKTGDVIYSPLRQK